MFDSAQLPVGRSTLTVRYNGDENVAATTTTVEQRVRRAISRVSTEVLDETVVVRKTRAWVEVTVELPDFPRAKPEGRVRITDRFGGVLGRSAVDHGTALVRLEAFKRAGTRTLTVSYSGTPQAARSNSDSAVDVVRR
jgi:hypothetical protein